MCIPAACAREGNIMVGQAVSHGNYQLHYEHYDRYVVAASCITSIALVGLSLIIAIVRAYNQEPGGKRKVALSFFSLMFVLLFTIGSSIFM